MFGKGIIMKSSKLNFYFKSLVLKNFFRGHKIPALTAKDLYALKDITFVSGFVNIEGMGEETKSHFGQK